MEANKNIKIRPLERKDLTEIYKLENTRKIMALWFEEPYYSIDELVILYDKHITDQSERRFVIEENGVFVGIIELVEIDYIHRHAEIQIIISDNFQSKGFGQQALERGIEYGFKILNLHKIYLYVDKENKAAIHIYKKFGFEEEGLLKKHFFAEGEYRDTVFMGLIKK